MSKTESETAPPPSDHIPKELVVVPIMNGPIFPGMIAPIILSEDRYTTELDENLSKQEYLALNLVKHKGESEEGEGEEESGDEKGLRRGRGPPSGFVRGYLPGRRPVQSGQETTSAGRLGEHLGSRNPPLSDTGIYFGGAFDRHCPRNSRRCARIR